MQISDLLRHSTQHLETASDSPRLDAEILLVHCLQKPRSFLYTWPEHVPTQQQLTEYTALLQQRQSGQPIAYLTGYREFWGIPLKVTPDTLIPRPETELLIETTLQYFTDRTQAERDSAHSASVNHRSTQPERSHSYPRILDLGTGSGAIALALSSELPSAIITATDKSAAALAIAQDNARQQQQAITFLLSDWFSAIPAAEKFDLIVSNPPYIAADDKHLTQGDVRFEPQTALTSGPDGLDDIRHLISHARHYLAPGGLFMLEHGYDQAAAINLMLQQNSYINVHCLKDLAGNDRISCGHY